jgi:hypothetical protein
VVHEVGTICDNDDKYCGNKLGYESCGPIIAYDKAHVNYSIEKLDSLSLISGKMKINSVHGSMAGIKWFDDLIGTEVPIRFLDEDSEGFVQVAYLDIVLGLCVAGKLKTARWFEENSIPYDMMYWPFKASDCPVEMFDEPVNSLEYFGADLDPEVREYIDDSIPF